MNYFTLIKSCNKILITVLFFFSITMLFQNQTLADDGSFETRGEIQSISSDSLTVNNLTFKVDGNTVVKNDNETVIPYSQLNVGMFVEIEAVVLSDSSLLAKIINMHTEKDDLEIEGFVNSVGGNSLVVNNVTVFVDNNTVISGEEDSLKTFSDIRVGNFVNIKAVRLTGDTLLAVRIKLQTENSQDKIEIEGTINNINQDTLVVNNFNVVVDANTVIQTDEHVRLSLSELKVGQKVDIKAVLLTNTVYLAKKINVNEVNGNSDQTFEFTTTIDSLIGNSILLNGILVHTDSTTEFMSQNHTPKLFSDLKVGMKIKAEGIIKTDGTYLARKIKIQEIWNEDVEVKGTIDSKGSDWLKVLNQKYYVNSSSQLFNFDLTPISFNSLTVGLKVEIEAYASSNNDSLYVKKLNVHDSTTVDVYGKIDSINANTFYVSNQKFVTNSNTTVILYTDTLGTVNDLAVNQSVEITALLQPDNSYLVLVVKIEEDPNVTKVSGFINNVTQNSLSVALPSFTITANTVVLNSNYQTISFSNLTAGQKVTVWGNQVGPSQVVALQIVANTGIVTGIKDIKNQVTIPDNFSLSQNYPNPFNPSTRIRYTLNKSSFVTLKIYNILGKEVATLVNEQKPSGTFEVTFIANNLASGVYFYRIQVYTQGRAGSFVKTKKLILMK